MISKTVKMINNNKNDSTGNATQPVLLIFTVCRRVLARNTDSGTKQCIMAGPHDVNVPKHCLLGFRIP